MVPEGSSRRTRSMCIDVMCIGAGIIGESIIGTSVSATMHTTRRRLNLELLE